MESYTILNYVILMEAIHLLVDMRHKRILYSAFIVLLLFIISMIINNEVFTGLGLIISGILEAYKNYFLSINEKGDAYYFWYNEIFRGYLISFVLIFMGIFPVLNYIFP